MRTLRDRLLSIAAGTKIAVAFGPAVARRRLGGASLNALDLLMRRNGIRADGVSVYFDQGIFGRSVEAHTLAAALPRLSGLHLFPEEDSRVCLGIQVADVVAHTVAQVVREAITDKRKIVRIGGADTGWHEDEKAPLGWFLLMGLRHSFFTQRVVTDGETFDPETDPLIQKIDDDPVTVSIEPQLLGWGAVVSDDSTNDLRRAVEKTLGRIWLGCIH